MSLSPCASHSQHRGYGQSVAGNLPGTKLAWEAFLKWECWNVLESKRIFQPGVVTGSCWPHGQWEQSLLQGCKRNF